MSKIQLEQLYSARRRRDRVRTLLLPALTLAVMSAAVGAAVAVLAFPPPSARNYLRIPALGSGLTLLVFLPGIVEQGASTYLAATGQTQ